jgi:hypothetical protein
MKLLLNLEIRSETLLIIVSFVTGRSKQNLRSFYPFFYFTAKQPSNVLSHKKDKFCNFFHVIT